MGEEAAASNDVLWVVELEQAGFTGLERSEQPVAAGLPEVHLVQVGAVSQEAVPVPVRDGDVSPHGRESSRVSVVPLCGPTRRMPAF
jgi:hypothetical protein